MPPSRSWKNIYILLGPVLAAVAYLVFQSTSGDPKIAGMAATVALMAVWWVTQAVPLALTSLMPMICFPLFGILSTRATAQNFMNPLIMLFIGGFLIALGMQRWNLHHRIALHVISKLGYGPKSLVLGFMVAAAMLSMWISNTATAMMMVAIGLAVVKELDETCQSVHRDKLNLAIMLAIAYGCSSGGVGTIVGTPTNLVFISLQSELFPDIREITFGSWLIFGVPLTMGLVAINWTMLTQVFLRKIGTVELDRTFFLKKVREHPAMSYEEKVIAVIFGLTSVLWVFRKSITVGDFTLPGWSSFWPPLSRLDDGVVAIFMATLLFVIPARNEKSRLLEKDVFNKMPWDIILLFCGGFALAGGFQSSGFSEYLTGGFTALNGLPPVLIILIICFSLSFLTEFTSNTAMAAMALPVLAALAPNLGIHPFLVLIPAAVAASMAFMMPVATPPNAIIFSSGKVTVPQMAKFGFVLNILTGFWVVMISQMLLPLILE